MPCKGDRPLEVQRQRLLRQHRQDRSGAKRCASRSVHAMITAIGTALTAIIRGNTHVSRHHLLGGHVARVSHRQVHPRGYENREKQNENPSERPTPHNRQHCAELCLKQAEAVVSAPNVAQGKARSAYHPKNKWRLC